MSPSRQVPRLPRNLSHTIVHTPSFTHHIVTHHLSHTATDHLSHTIFHHTIFYTPSFTTPSFTHKTLSHTIFHHTIFHTQLCHTPSFATPSFTHHFVAHHLSRTTLSHARNFRTHTIFDTTLSHTHTIFLCHTPDFTYNFVTHNFFLLFNPPPPPLSFLPSLSPLQHLVLGKSWACKHWKIKNIYFVIFVSCFCHSGLSLWIWVVIYASLCVIWLSYVCHFIVILLSFWERENEQKTL